MPIYFESALCNPPLRSAGDRLYLPDGSGLGVTL
jgi:hypothetical protein